MPNPKVIFELKPAVGVDRFSSQAVRDWIAAPPDSAASQFDVEALVDHLVARKLTASVVPWPDGALVELIGSREHRLLLFASYVQAVAWPAGSREGEVDRDAHDIDDDDPEDAVDDALMSLAGLTGWWLHDGRELLSADSRICPLCDAEIKEFARVCGICGGLGLYQEEKGNKRYEPRIWARSKRWAAVAIDSMVEKGAITLKANGRGSLEQALTKALADDGSALCTDDVITESNGVNTIADEYDLQAILAATFPAPAVLSEPYRCWSGPGGFGGCCFAAVQPVDTLPKLTAERSGNLEPGAPAALLVDGSTAFLRTLDAVCIFDVRGTELGQVALNRDDASWVGLHREGLCVVNRQISAFTRATGYQQAATVSRGDAAMTIVSTAALFSDKLTSESADLPKRYADALRGRCAISDALLLVGAPGSRTQSAEASVYVTANRAYVSAEGYHLVADARCTILRQGRGTVQMAHDGGVIVAGDGVVDFFDPDLDQSRFLDRGVALACGPRWAVCGNTDTDQLDVIDLDFGEPITTLEKGVPTIATDTIYTFRDNTLTAYDVYRKRDLWKLDVSEPVRDLVPIDRGFLLMFADGTIQTWQHAAIAAQ